MAKDGHKKKRPFLAAYLSPFQAIQPVAIYRADSYVTMATTIDQLPAAAYYPWSILVGSPAHVHVSVCFVRIHASTVMLNTSRLAIYTHNSSKNKPIPGQDAQTVSVLTFPGRGAA